MEDRQILSSALDIGEQLLVNGAEVYRVEECIRRICTAYGARRVDVFTITSSIAVTIETASGEALTQTRRIHACKTDLNRVDLLNGLSREMCRTTMDYETFREKLQAIEKSPIFPERLQFLTYGCTTAAFTVFFGGSWADAAVSFFVGLTLYLAVRGASLAGFNGVISNLVSSFVISFLTIFAVSHHLGDSMEMIVIGNIMPLIPGTGLTNALRDMISGDTIAGILRFCEACIMAFAIAAGYILASMALGGIGL